MSPRTRRPPSTDVVAHDYRLLNPSRFTRSGMRSPRPSCRGRLLGISAPPIFPRQVGGDAGEVHRRAAASAASTCRRCSSTLPQEAPRAATGRQVLQLAAVARSRLRKAMVAKPGWLSDVLTRGPWAAVVRFATRTPVNVDTGNEGDLWSLVSFARYLSKRKTREGDHAVMSPLTFLAVSLSGVVEPPVIETSSLSLEPKVV